MSTYDTALQASREYTDKRTPAQRKWDERSYAVHSAVAKLRTITSGTQAHSWSRNSDTLEHVSGLLQDALREVKALQIEGFREGDAVKPLVSLATIETRPVGIERDEKVTALGKGAA